MAKTTDPAPIIKKILSNETAPSSILVLSEDKIRIDRVITMIAEKFDFQKDGKWTVDLNKIRIKESSESDLKQLAFKSNELSLFSQKKVILIQGIEDITAGKTDLILKILESSPTDNLIIITGTKLKANSRVYKPLKKANTIIKLDPFSSNEMFRWITKEVQDFGLKANKKDLETLTVISEDSADKAYRIIEMLDLYCEDRAITDKSISALFPTEFTAGQFKWLDLIDSKKALQAEKHALNLIKNGGVPFMMVGSLYARYSNYYTISSMLKNGRSNNEIKQHLGVTPWLLNKYISVARNQNPQELKSKLAEILRADSMLKNKSLGTDNIISGLIQRLAK